MMLSLAWRNYARVTDSVLPDSGLCDTRVVRGLRRMTLYEPMVSVRMRDGTHMTYIVNDNCINCKYTDCVEVAWLIVFTGENMLVIHPDECIDCGV